MFVPRKIKKILRLLRGQVSPVLAGLSVGLGFWFGLMPGFYGIHALLLVLLLLLNVPIGLFILSLGVGKAAALAAAPLLFHTGGWVQAHLSGLIAVCERIPVVGLTDFSRYALVGGLLLGPALGAVLGLLFGGMILGFRKTWLKLETNTERFNQWYNKGWVKVLDRLVIGKRGAKDARQALAAKTKLLRKAGVALAVIALILLLLVSWLFQKQIVRDRAAAKLTEINGATVDIDRLNLSPLSGAVELAGLGVTDRTDPRKNSLAIGAVATRASLYQMSLGKLVLNQVKVSDVRFDSPRETPGTVIAPAAEDTTVTGSGDGPGTGSDGRWSMPDANAADLERYLDQYEKLKAWLEKIRPWLPGGDSNEPDTVSQPEGYLGYLQAKGGPLDAVRVLAREVLMEKVILPSRQFGSSTLRLTNLNDAPEVAQLPIGLEVTADAGASLVLQVHYEDPETPGRVTGTFQGFDLATLQDGLKSNNALRFEGGHAGGSLEGFLTQDGVNLTIAADLTDLQAQAPGGLFGIDPQVVQEALKTVAQLNVRLRIVGPLTDPKVSFETGDLRQQLLAAGKRRVLGEIERQIQDKAPDEVKQLLDSNDFRRGLDGLIRR